jgi:regulator of protease activity HflC (stomatin/prohibitin superfamily)
MQRMMARQAEAEREKRAKVIHAEGEYLAAERLTGAAKIISTTPSALQLRFLQTVTEVASEKTSVIVLPIPLELFRGFMTQGNGEASA